MVELGHDILSLLLLADDCFVLAQTCKEILHLALHRRVLIPFVNSLLKTAKDGVGALPKFLYASLPSTLVNSDVDVKSALNLKSCAVSGGYCVKSIYNLDYKSDADVWVQPDKPFSIDEIEYTIPSECKRFQIKSSSEEYDVVVRKHEPYQAISLFDLSICSVSMVYDECGVATPHITPLFLYTHYTKNIVVTSLALKENYEVPDGFGATMSITTNDCVKNHLRHLKDREDWHEGLEFEVPFHDCWWCSHTAVCKTPLMTRWRERLTKYAKRFSDHTLIHVDHPK